MNTFKHVSNTWLLAQLVHPLVFIAGLMPVGGIVDVYMFFVLYILGFIFSLPAYLLCLAFFGSILQMPYDPLVKLFIWCLASVACVITGFFLICLAFLDVRAFMEGFVFIIPGCVATVIAVLLRYKQFRNFTDLQMVYHEDDLV
jgi:hypothetical protein